MNNKPISFTQFVEGTISGFALLVLLLFIAPVCLIIAAAVFPYILVLAVVVLVFYAAVAAVVYVVAALFHVTKFAYGLLPESYRVLPDCLGLNK